MQDGRFTPLQGDTNLTLGTTHLHHIRRMLQTNAVAEIFTMQLIEPNSIQFPLLELPTDMEPELVLKLHSSKTHFQFQLLMNYISHTDLNL